jgi:hypothetical protein
MKLAKEKKTIKELIVHKIHYCSNKMPKILQIKWKSLVLILEIQKTRHLKMH